jgi:Uma2 family endonuclease
MNSVTTSTDDVITELIDVRAIARVLGRRIDVVEGELLEDGGSARFTYDEVERLAESGAFVAHGERRIELIRGELRVMSPIGINHEDVVDWLADWSYEIVDLRRVRIRVQQSLGIPELSTMPQPDIAWVKRRRYRRRRPPPADVLLLIEVADSSLAHDMGAKAQLYADAGLQDYWVVDIPNRRLHIYRDPGADGFAVHQKLSGDMHVTPLLLDGIELVVADMFAPLELDNSEGEQ